MNCEGTLCTQHWDREKRSFLEGITSHSHCFSKITIIVLYRITTLEDDILRQKWRSRLEGGGTGARAPPPQTKDHKTTHLANIFVNNHKVGDVGRSHAITCTLNVRLRLQPRSFADLTHSVRDKKQVKTDNTERKLRA